MVLHFGCVEEFDPSSKGYENLLVVEAFLSNDDENFIVMLARSTPIDTNAVIPERGADVSLVSLSGDQFDLFETSSGTYESNGPIYPVVGMDYQLKIQTRNSKTYESKMVKMRDTPPIKDAYFKFEEIPSAGLKGVQFYIDTEDPNNNTWFYRWEWEETWIFRVAFRANLKYEDGEIKDREEDIFTCWKSGRSTSIEIATSKNLSKDIINEYPINYVSSETDQLSQRYSFNVKQYSLSEESYNYWKELQKATENLGTLFDPQPSIVKGNYYNVDDENEIILGYFDAAVVREQRVFVNRADIPGIKIPYDYANCEDSIVSKYMIPEMDDSGWEMIDEEEVAPGSFVYHFSTNYCIDCTLYGTNTRPDFW